MALKKNHTPTASHTDVVDQRSQTQIYQRTAKELKNDPLTADWSKKSPKAAVYITNSTGKIILQPTCSTESVFTEPFSAPISSCLVLLDDFGVYK